MEEKTAVRKSYKKMPRKKVCAFCQEKVTEIVPRRMSGTCAAHQRVLATAIKRARIASLLPFKGE